jgi:hypothetical protein
MNYREADGGDKIAAFEQGMTDADAHLAFETDGVTSVIVAETFLVVYAIREGAVTELLRRRLYDNGGTRYDVADYLAAEAHKFGCQVVIGIE